MSGRWFIPGQENLESLSEEHDPGHRNHGAAGAGIGAQDDGKERPHDLYLGLAIHDSVGPAQRHCLAAAQDYDPPCRFCPNAHFKSS